MHVKTLLVAAIAVGWIRCEGTTGRTEEDGEATESTLTTTSTARPPLGAGRITDDGETFAEGKYSKSDTSGPERLRKPFFYGRKFEFPDKEKKETGNGALYAPIITSPILTLPYETANLGPGSHTEPEILKQNQNEILTSVRDFIKETRERKEAGSGGEEDSEGKRREETSRSREHGERSLLVVLPFKADKENVEELFTKSPMVKVIEEDELESGGTKPSPVIREIIPTTSEPVTQKRWRPLKRHRLTTETPLVETTTENGEDVTRTYTNYNDVEMVTKKYLTGSEEPEKLTNHKAEAKFTPYPVYKGLKIKKGENNEGVEGVEKPKETKPKRRKGLKRKSTTEGPPKPEELSKVLEILPPDMKELILELELNKEKKGEERREDDFRLERAPQPTIDPKSYAVFKPLPLEPKEENRNLVAEDMKDFLASFGLLPGSGRRVEKSLKENATRGDEKVSDGSLDFLPNDLKLVLEEMGLVKGEEKKEPTRIHIFNPSNHSIARNEEDLEKLNAILSSIKTTVNESGSLTADMQSEIIEKIRELNKLRYKEGNLTEITDEIRKIVVTKSGETKPRTARRATKLNEGPDPLMFDDESVLKNDVKRQDVRNSTETTEMETAATTTTTTEEAPNIEALKESFGGGETASDDEDIESSLPPKRPNGLYLLLDWNSFLEVGTEDDKRRVNLRFQPKIGDSRNFLPVSVP